MSNPKRNFDEYEDIVIGPKYKDSNINHIFINSAIKSLSEAEPGNILEIASSQIKLLSSYYDLALFQARRSFRWALIAAGIGLIFFLASVVFLLIQSPQQISTVSLISGALIEVISGINFYLYGKTSSQLADFLTRLDLTQRYLLANSMCESLDGEFKQKARMNLITSVAGFSGGTNKLPNESASES